MKTIVDILEERVSAVMAEVAGQRGCAAMVGPATDAKFGDYQANGVMALAKKLKTNPRELAEKIIEKLDVSDICERPEIAGPGFINFRLKKEFLEKRLLQLNLDLARLGIEETQKPQTVVVDFSGPNIAKQMHVGHLRSTIIGDCICRLLEFEGHKVIRQNHIGDWGTQFGMLIAYWHKVRYDEAVKQISKGEKKVPLNISLMEDFYKNAQNLFAEDEQFAKASRQYVVKLHSGEKNVMEDWNLIVTRSLNYCQGIYDYLGVKLGLDDVRGESFYKDMLPGIVEELLKRKIAEKSEGAICIFPDKEKFKTKDGNPMPLIIRKTDEAYLYATTDLAALRYRVRELKADRIIYVTDARQKLHFEMLFAVAKAAGWLKEGQAFHVTFGSVLGEDGRPLKTREGENVKLKELLDEAVKRARGIVEEKNPEFSEQKKADIARAVGIGAVKYADFSNNRTSDYIFSFEKMLAMEGNTAPYMQYAYARIKSIERKAQLRDVDVETELSGVKSLDLSEAAELDLAKQLVRYGEAIEACLADFRPNYLTSYLYELAQRFSGFYTNCPVLKAGPDKRPTRLMLCDLTAKTIRHGLAELLGIEVVEQM